MTQSEFMIEEYKQLYKAIENYQNHYTTLENLTIGGAIAAYGFLLVHPEVPAFGWGILPALILISAARCSAFYWLINREIAPKIAEIEDALYKERFQGHQRSLRGRKINFLFNTVVWVSLLSGSLFALYWRLSQPTHSPPFVSWPW